MAELGKGFSAHQLPSGITPEGLLSEVSDLRLLAQTDSKNGPTSAPVISVRHPGLPSRFPRLSASHLAIEPTGMISDLAREFGLGNRLVIVASFYGETYRDPETGEDRQGDTSLGWHDDATLDSGSFATVLQGEMQFGFGGPDNPQWHEYNPGIGYYQKAGESAQTKHNVRTLAGQTAITLAVFS